LALINIPEPMIHAKRRLIASSRPIVGGFLDVLVDKEGTSVA
jgi:hypothetical protein